MLTLWALLMVLAVTGSRLGGLAGREYARLQAQSRTPGSLPLWALVTNEVIVYGSVPVALVSGLIMLEHWWSRLTAPTLRQRVLFLLANLGLGLLFLALVGAVFALYEQDLSRLTRIADPLLGPAWIRVGVVILVVGLGLLQAWRSRRPPRD